MKLNIQNNNMEEVAGISAQYPYVYRKVDGRETSVPWHWHEEVEFSYVLRGNLRVTLPGQSYIFQENQGFFINSNILHTMEPPMPRQEPFGTLICFIPCCLAVTTEVFSTANI